LTRTFAVQTTKITTDAGALLRIWEAQQGAHPVRRAVHLLAQAWPDTGPEGWLHAPIGMRDGALLRLHDSLFGDALRTSTACPHCGERIEPEFGVRDLLEGAGAPGDAPGTHSLVHRGHAIDYRLPTSDDLLAVTGRGDSAAGAAQRLMQRCVSRARRGSDEIDAGTLPDDVVAALGDAMARQDPQAEVRVALTCPACRVDLQVHFDIVSHLWSELDDWAQRVLADVHVLARAYGWDEDAILALSPARRAIYLEMVGA
jgi:hypothetical protein